MEHTIGCTTRPYASVSFAEACEHIAEAGYSDVAVFRNTGSVAILVSADTSGANCDSVDITLQTTGDLA